MKPARLSVLLVGVVLSSLLQFNAGNRLCAQTQPGLSVADNAELLQKDITDASNKKQYSRLIALIEKYKQLPAPAPRVAAFDYLEAWAAFYIGDHKRALSAAVAYANAPDGKQYHEDALELIHKIQLEDEQKAEQQLQIHWTSGVSSKPAVRHGQASVDGQIIKVGGMSLSCNLWMTPAGLSPNGNWWRLIIDDLSHGRWGYDAGRAAASQFWSREEVVFTQHFIDMGSADPGAKFHTFPWEGNYQTTAASSDPGVWYYVGRSDSVLVVINKNLWLADTAGAEANTWHDFYTTVYFDVDLKGFEVHQRITPSLTCQNSPCTDPYLGGFQSFTDAQPPVCKLIPYRKPPDPPLPKS